MMKNTIIDYLEEIAIARPNKVAFINDDRSIDFFHLAKESKKLATMLIEQNDYNSGKPIVIFLNKNIECVIAIMGVLYSGLFYTIIDTKMPQERLERIFLTVEPYIVVTDCENYEHIKNAFNGKTLINIKDIKNYSVDEDAIRNCLEQKVDTDPAYVLFTSGSTGVPKGVVVPHRALIDFIGWFSMKFGFDDTDVLGNQAPLYFDASIPDVFLPIVTGATTVLLSNYLFSYPIKIIEQIKKFGINNLVWVPTALIIMANFNVFKNIHDIELKRIMFCGEVMPCKQLEYWQEHFTSTQFVNLYGPTEAVYACTYFEIKRKYKENECLPIGVPCKNTRVYVLNSEDAMDTSGELCIAGSSLALGYYGDEERTKAVFIQNPTNSKYIETIYRTGDLVRYNDNGELLYIGRKDNQIKHMGYRIELGEIETALGSCNGINRSCVIYDDVNKKILAFCQAQSDFSKITCKQQLTKILPQYMVPGIFILLEELPLNANGKVDRVVLKNSYKNNKIEVLE